MTTLLPVIKPPQVFSAFERYTVKAGAILRCALPGTYVEILDSNLPSFKLTVPGREPLKVSAGLSIPFELFSGFTIDNSENANDLTVFLHVGTVSVGDRRAVKAAPNYGYSNAGVTTNINSDGFITLSKANFPSGITVGNTNNGNRRFQVVFSVLGGSSNYLVICDANGNPLVTHFNNSNLTNTTFQTDAIFVLKTGSWNSGGSCLVMIGELYYAN